MRTSLLTAHPGVDAAREALEYQQALLYALTFVLEAGGEPNPEAYTLIHLSLALGESADLSLANAPKNRQTAQPVTP